MCNIGDIILIDEYNHGSLRLRHHSFVVMQDEAGEIRGYPYDIICNVLSSFRDDNQKHRKLAFPGNFPIVNDDTHTTPDNGKDGYLKTDQLYYFKKDKISYQIIGYMKPDIFQLVLEFVSAGEFKIRAITDNLIE